WSATSSRAKPCAGRSRRPRAASRTASSWPGSTVPPMPARLRRLRLRPEAWPMVAVLCLAACVAAPAARAADAPTLLADDTPPPPDATVLYLQVRLNGNDTGRIARFLMQDGRLSASAETLRQLGFTLAGHAAPDIVPLD